MASPAWEGAAATLAELAGLLWVLLPGELLPLLWAASAADAARDMSVDAVTKLALSPLLRSLELNTRRRPMASFLWATDTGQGHAHACKSLLKTYYGGGGEVKHGP